MEFHPTPRFPSGFRCAARNCGMKESAEDLALFVSDVPAAAAAVFTRNRFPGAPILVGRELIREGTLQGIVVNSKVSNVATGEEGVRRARRMGAAAAAEIGAPVDRVLMSSTGVIGVPLPIEKIEAGLAGMASLLGDDPMAGARGIMTTDSHPKALSLSVGNATLTCVAKGSGMIAPNMATMLVYLFTDARLPSESLDPLLRRIVDRTFNMLSVDSDTSTSDTCAILANGLAGPVDEAAFEAALLHLCRRMTEILARDGEGATRLLHVEVTGTADEKDARTIVRSLLDSPLIKTMVHGADPNVGRILMAVGKCVEVPMTPEEVDGWINGIRVIAGGMRAPFPEPEVRAGLRGDPVELRIAMGDGPGMAEGWGCDLGPGYIEENGAYYSS